MGAALAHLLRADAHRVAEPGRDRFTGPDSTLGQPKCGNDQARHAAGIARSDRLAEAQTVAAQLTATGQRISRRALRQAGIHGSNADLGLIAHIVKPLAAGITAATGKT